ncbi:hypothetical protein ACFL0V_01765, partial [Nanoarchaeota archaeon]
AKNTVVGMVEVSQFEEAGKEKLLELYKRLMFFHRRCTELSIDDSDEKNVELINDVVKEWDSLKEKSLEFVSKLKDAWTKDLNKKEVVGYLG